MHVSGLVTRPILITKGRFQQNIRNLPSLRHSECSNKKRCIHYVHQNITSFYEMFKHFLLLPSVFPTHSLSERAANVTVTDGVRDKILKENRPNELKEV